MKMKKILIGVIIVLVGVLLVTAYLNRGCATSQAENQNQAKLTLAWGEQEYTLTMEQIKELEADTFPIVQRSSDQEDKEQTYTGVELTQIIELAGISLDDYSQVNVMAVDGYTVAVSKDELLEQENAYLVYLLNEEPLGTKSEGGRGPYQLIIRNDTYAQRWCKFVTEIENAMNPLLEVNNLSFRYGEDKPWLFDNISLAVEAGEVVALVGLSGVGKSTLAYCLSGIIPHIYQGEMRGEVLIGGAATTSVSLPQLAGTVGIVFQNPDTQLFSPTVEDEIAFGPENLCVEPAEIGRRIEEVLTIVAMQKHRYASPHQLSGGQKQRIALAAVLALQPQLLVLDEVMSQLDKTGVNSVKQVINSLKQKGKGLVMVEHDLTNLSVADRILVLKEGQLQRFEGSL